MCIGVPAVVDPHAAAFFQKQMLEAENNVCCDGGAGDATWVSITYGIYLSIGAAGMHRSLGVKTSFVQSTVMDSWKPKHLKMMELGGNRRFNEFLAAHGIPMDMPIREKYQTRAAVWYRKNLAALADGAEHLEPLPLGTGHLPADEPRSPLQKTLDEVYADVPKAAALPPSGLAAQQVQTSTAASSPQDEECRETPASSSICQQLAACFRWRSQPLTETPKSPRSPDQSYSQLRQCSPREGEHCRRLSLPLLLGSTECQTAKRLQSFSTGKMEGFGP